MELSKPRFRLEEAAQLLGISRAKLYERVKEKRIAVEKDGRDSFITADEIQRYANQSHPNIERFQSQPAG